jgi:hypothetical protein
MKSIKQKIKTNHLTITKADKGNTTVTIQEDDYNKKIEFIIGNKFIKLTHDIIGNKFIKLTHDIINTLQKGVRNCLNNSKHKK